MKANSQQLTEQQSGRSCCQLRVTVTFITTHTEGEEDAGKEMNVQLTHTETIRLFGER